MDKDLFRSNSSLNFATAHFNSKELRQHHRPNQAHPTQEKWLSELIEFMFICMTIRHPWNSTEPAKASHSGQHWPFVSVTYKFPLFKHPQKKREKEYDHHAFFKSKIIKKTKNTKKDTNILSVGLVLLFDSFFSFPSIMWAVLGTLTFIGKLI